MATRIDGSMVHGTSPATQIPRLPHAAGLYTYGEQLAKPLENGDWAVLLLNRRNTTTQITLNFLDLADTTCSCFTVRDVLSHTDLGVKQGVFDGGLVPAHGCRFLRLSPYVVGPNCTRLDGTVQSVLPLKHDDSRACSRYACSRAADLLRQCHAALGRRYTASQRQDNPLVGPDNPSEQPESLHSTNEDGNLVCKSMSNRHYCCVVMTAIVDIVRLIVCYGGELFPSADAGLEGPLASQRLELCRNGRPRTSAVAGTERGAGTSVDDGALGG